MRDNTCAHPLFFWSTNEIDRSMWAMLQNNKATTMTSTWKMKHHTMTKHTLARRSSFLSVFSFSLYLCSSYSWVCRWLHWGRAPMTWRGKFPATAHQGEGSLGWIAAAVVAAAGAVALVAAEQGEIPPPWAWWPLLVWSSRRPVTDAGCRSWRSTAGWRVHCQRWRLKGSWPWAWLPSGQLWLILTHGSQNPCDVIDLHNTK